MKFPWWLSVVAGLSLYGIFTYLLPRLEFNGPIGDFCKLAPKIAPLISIPLLLLGAKQLYDIPSKDAPYNEKNSREDL